MQQPLSEQHATPQPAAPTKPGVDIGRCLNDAIEVFTKNLLILVFASFLFMVLSVFTLGILAGPLCGGLSIMTLEAMRREDKRVELARLFAGFGDFFSLLILFIVVVVAAIIGTIFFIVPGLVIMTVWLFPFYLVMDKRVDIWAALGMSYEIVMRRGFWPNFLLLLLIVAISIGPELIPFVGTVVGIVVMPIAWMMSTSAYIQEVDEDGHAAIAPQAGAKCGNCGYATRGLSTFVCPECGCDLREVGMIPTQS